MKSKFYYILLLLLWFNCGLSQLMNTGFEEWEIINESNFPSSWVIQGPQNCEPNSTIFQSNDSLDGEYSIMFTAGCLYTDTYSSQSIWQTLEFNPTAEKPTSLSFYNKHQNISFLFQDSVGCAYVEAFIQHDTNPITYSVEYFYRNSQEEVNEWTYEEINLSHLSNVKFVYLTILGGSCDTGISSEGNSEFLIDNINLNTEIISNNSNIETMSIISLYPNPVTNNLHLTKVHDGIIRVFSQIGQLLLIEKTSSMSNYILNISKLKAGSYILEHENKNGIG